MVGPVQRSGPSRARTSSLPVHWTTGLVECSSGLPDPEEPGAEANRIPGLKHRSSIGLVAERGTVRSEMEQLPQRTGWRYLHKSDTYRHAQECQSGPKVR